MFGKTETKMNKPRDGRHCDLCGCSFPAVRCDKCSSQIFCLSCDDMYHRHPKRKFHLRKAVDPTPTPQARPVLPLKVSNLGVAPGDPSKMPLPPPRKKKPGKSIFDSFRRGSPANDTSPTLPKKEYSWTDKLGSITKFMSNRPLPPVPDSAVDDKEDDPAVPNNVSNHNLAFIHRKVDEKPPALPQRQPRSPQQSPFQTNGDNTNAEPNMTNGNASGFVGTLRHNAEENQKWPMNPQMSKPPDVQGFGTLPPHSQLQDTLSRTPFKPSGMHQSSSASDLTALSDLPLGPSMQPYPPYSFNPHFTPPYPYPMYPQYPPYPQYLGNSWANLSNPPSGNEQDLSDSEASSKKFNRGRFKGHMERKAKRSQSVMVDRMAYPGHFHPFGPFPPMYPGHPWMHGHAAEAPPSPGPYRHSLSRASHRKKKATDDEDEDFDEFSSSPLSRPKSSSSAEVSKNRTRSKPKNYPSSSSSEHEREGESHIRPKASPTTKKKHFKQHTLKRKSSSPQQSPTMHKNDQAEHAGLQMAQQVSTPTDPSPEMPHDDVVSTAEKVGQLSLKNTESPVPDGSEKFQEKRLEESNQQLSLAGWQCKYCTYINSSETHICQVCCKTACKSESPVSQDERKSSEKNESPDFTKSSTSANAQHLQSSNVEIPGSPDRHDIAILNSALDEAEKQINESLEELLKVKEESAMSEKKASASKADGILNHSISSSSKSTVSSSANATDMPSRNLLDNVSSPKDTAVQHISTSINSSHTQVDNPNIPFPSHASVSTSSGEQQKRDATYGNDVAISEPEIPSAEARKDSFCQTYQDVPPNFMPQNVGFMPMNNSQGPSVLKSGHQPFDRDFGQSTLPYNFYQPPVQDRGFGNGFNGMHRAHSRASLFGGRLSDAMPAALEYGGMGVGFGAPPSSMIRSLSRASLLGESEGWGNEYPGRPKPDFYLSMEELVERRRQETMRAQGLELVQMIREAEQQGFTADDIQVALNNCGKQNPVKWLQDNWRNLIRTVVTLATNYGKDKRENDVGLVSDSEARDALRLHKGNIWAAVTECVEGRQRKFLELSARGNFSFKEILDALTDSEGDVELAYAKLTNTTLKPFLMRIWGSGEGVPNLEGAQPLLSLDKYLSSDKQNADTIGNSERNDIEAWEEEYGDDIPWEDEDVYGGNSENEEEQREESVDLSSQEVASFKSDDLEKSEQYHTLTRDTILSPESDKSDYCDAFGSGLGDRYLSSTSIDEIYLIDADVEGEINFDSKSSIESEEDTRRKSTGFLNKLAALRKNSLFDKARKGESFSTKANEEIASEIKEQNNFSENANIPAATMSDDQKEAVEESEGSGFIQPLNALKQTFTALKDAVSGSSSKTAKSSPSIYNRRTIIVHGRIAHETVSSESPHDVTSSTNSCIEPSFEKHACSPADTVSCDNDTKVSVDDIIVDIPDVNNSQSKFEDAENTVSVKEFKGTDSKESYASDTPASSTSTSESVDKLYLKENDVKVPASSKKPLVSELAGSKEYHMPGVKNKREKYFNNATVKLTSPVTALSSQKEIVSSGDIALSKSSGRSSTERVLTHRAEKNVESVSESIDLSEQINIVPTNVEQQTSSGSKFSNNCELSESLKLSESFSEVKSDKTSTTSSDINVSLDSECICINKNSAAQEDLASTKVGFHQSGRGKDYVDLSLIEKSTTSVPSPEQEGEMMELMHKPESPIAVTKIPSTSLNKDASITAALKTTAFEKTTDLHRNDTECQDSASKIRTEVNTAETTNIHDIKMTSENIVVMKDVQDIQLKEEAIEGIPELDKIMKIPENNQILMKTDKQDNLPKSETSETAKIPITSHTLAKTESIDDSVKPEADDITKVLEDTCVLVKPETKVHFMKSRISETSESCHILEKSRSNENLIKSQTVAIMALSESLQQTEGREESRETKADEITKISENSQISAMTEDEEYTVKTETNGIMGQSETNLVLVKSESQGNSVKSEKKEDSIKCESTKGLEKPETRDITQSPFDIQTVPNTESKEDSLRSESTECLEKPETKDITQNPFDTQTVLNTESKDDSMRSESTECQVKPETKDITQSPLKNQTGPQTESKEDSIGPETSQIEKGLVNAHNFLKPENQEDSVKPGTSEIIKLLDSNQSLPNTEIKEDSIMPDNKDDVTKLESKEITKQKVKPGQKKSKNKGLKKTSESKEDDTKSENGDNLIKGNSSNLKMKDESTSQAVEESSDLQISAKSNISSTFQESSKQEIADTDKKVENKTVATKSISENIPITDTKDVVTCHHNKTPEKGKASETSVLLATSVIQVNNSVEDAIRSSEQVKLISSEDKDLYLRSDEKLGIVDSETVLEESLSSTETASSSVQQLDEKIGEPQNSNPEQEKHSQLSLVDRDVVKHDNTDSLQTLSSVDSTSKLSEQDKQQQPENTAAISSRTSSSASNVPLSGQDKVDINQTGNTTRSSVNENNSVNNKLNKSHISLKSGEQQESLLHPVLTAVSPKLVQETTASSPSGENSRILLKNHDVPGDGKGNEANENISAVSSVIPPEDITEYQSGTTNTDANSALSKKDLSADLKAEEKELVPGDLFSSEVTDSATSSKHIPEAPVSEIATMKDTLVTKSDKNLNLTSSKTTSSGAENLTSVSLAESNDEDSSLDVSGNEDVTSLRSASPVRPVGHLRRMSFNTRREAIFRERNIESVTTEQKSWLVQKPSEPFKPVYSKRSIKQQLEFERKVRKYVSDRKCRTYRKAEIVVQLLEMNFEETEAIYAANECSNLDQAISFLQQECQLCAGKYPVAEIISMVHCSHKACKECIKAYFTIQIRDRTITELLCPFCNEPDITDEDVAQDYFNHLDIMLKKLVDVEIYELFQRKLRDRVLMKDPNFRWCSQCSSGFIADPYLKRLICPDCNAITCATCRRLWEREHEGVSCEAFAEWKDANDPESQTAGLAKLLTEDGIDCPSCHFRYALAKGGCMHFKCIQCQHDFCSGCSRPFRMGKKCGLSEFCAKLGLHAHHPRNCLFYLRDKEPEDLQRLLDMNDIIYNKGAPKSSESKTLCDVMEQKETSHGMVDDICGKEVQEGFAGLCRIHYVEYLGQLVNKHKIDPIQIFENDDLELVLKRASIRLPPKRYRESDSDYRRKLVELIEEKLPLGEVEGS